MEFAHFEMFRLSPRGAAGVACDAAGVALGPIDLVRIESAPGNGRACSVASLETLNHTLTEAYGPQPDNEVHRIHRGLERAAAAIEAGDDCLAGIETVLLGLPELSSEALALLADATALRKWGDAWQFQPRVPAGSPNGGEWVSSDEASSPASVPKPHIDDGVYRPQTDAPRVTLTGGPSEEENSRLSNNPPDEFTTLVQVFPGLQANPLVAVPLAPIDGFLGVSALADEANFEAAQAQYRMIVHEIQQIDPSFQPAFLLPEGGLEAMDWQGRANVIDSLLMQRAVAYYKLRGEVEPLQVETLKFLQKAVDAAYTDAANNADSGRLQPRLSRAEAIGNRMDRAVRDDLNDQFSWYGVKFGPGLDVTINNRDYDTSSDATTYRIPDARIRDVTYDWSLSAKTISWPQVRGYFGTDSQPRAVIIVRPTQLGSNNTYLIPRPADRSK